jgi:hypothetical protein
LIEPPRRNRHPSGAPFGVACMAWLDLSFEVSASGIELHQELWSCRA